MECITKVIRKAKSRWFGRLVRRDHEEHIKTFWRQEKKIEGEIDTQMKRWTIGGVAEYKSNRCCGQEQLEKNRTRLQPVIL